MHIRYIYYNTVTGKGIRYDTITLYFYNELLMTFEMECQMVSPSKGMFRVGELAQFDASVLA